MGAHGDYLDKMKLRKPLRNQILPTTAGNSDGERLIQVGAPLLERCRSVRKYYKCRAVIPSDLREGHRLWARGAGSTPAVQARLVAILHVVIARAAGARVPVALGAHRIQQAAHGNGDKDEARDAGQD